MLKWLAILAALLTGISSPPVPGETPQRDGQSSQKPEQKADPRQKPAQPALVIIQKNCGSEEFKNDSDCKAAKDKKATILVGKLPPAHVTIDGSAPRDNFDWLAYGFSIALAIAGIAGVVAAICTLFFIKRQWVEMRRQRILTKKTLVAINVQAGHMESQTTILRDSVAVAKKSADSAEESIALMKSKERARITVKIPSAGRWVTDMFWGIRFHVGNIGPSDAFNVSIMARLEFTQSSIPPKIPSPHGIRYFPRIRAGKRVSPITGPNDWEGSGEAEFDRWDEERMASVAGGKTFMHMRGTVDYEDIFGDPHVTPFRYMWIRERGGWVDVPHLEDPKAT